MSATVSSRRVQNQVMTFGFDEQVHKDNLLLYDEATGSLWSQLGQQAIQGSQIGTPLELLPAIQTSWAHWRTLFPHTDVVAYPPDEVLPFRYPLPVQRLSSENSRSQALGPNQLVLGITLEGSPKAYPFFELERRSVAVKDRIGSHEIVVHYNNAVPAAWATDLDGQCDGFLAWVA